MRKKLILDSARLDIMLSRLCQQLIEKHGEFRNAVVLGLQPRGIFLAEYIHTRLQELTGLDLPLGLLDATFHRDDFRRRDTPALASETRIDFMIEGKDVILIDDVLYTGRTVRAALDAMIAYGRPASVELLVLVDRKNSRDLPIEADYVGQYVNTLDSQRVLVELEAQGFEQNKIWLITT